MKFKRAIVAALCVIMSVCMLCGCSFFDKIFGGSNDTDTPSITTPETPDNTGSDEEQDPSGDNEKVPEKEPEKQPEKEPEKQPEKEPEPTKPDYGKFDENDFLKTDGQKVKNKTGDEIFLRGVNAGGLFVTEHWMTGFQNGKTDYSDDYKSLTKKFIERFGEEDTKRLWSIYRENWWTEQDFVNVASMGMTVIRVPFTYMNVDFAAITDYANAGKSYDFTALDEFVAGAAKHGLYTILDLHGAYGSQNGQDHSGECKEPEQVDFYYNTQMQELTVKLWDALSEHYKDNPAVAGYDILNEPGERTANGTQSTEKRHWDVFDKIYKAIRANGDDHIVMFESCWEGWNLPQPSVYGWSNCMYSFHHYPGDSISAAEHVASWESKLYGVASRNFGVPLQMGEFTAYDSVEKWDETLQLMCNNDWHWTSWTYKVYGNMPWGVVNVSGAKINAKVDSYGILVDKFKNFRTDKGSKYKFGNGETLEAVMTRGLAYKKEVDSEVNATVTIDKVGLVVDNGKPYAVFSGTFADCSQEKLAKYVVDGEISGRVKLTLEVVEYNAQTGRFTVRAEISAFDNGGSGQGRYYMHAGFEPVPDNLPAETATIDQSASTITVGGKKYSLGEEWGCRQIIVENA